MKLLFVCDPLASFHLAKDSTLAMMREADRRGHTLWVCHTHDLFWLSGQTVSAQAQRLHITHDPIAWFDLAPHATHSLASFDAVLMRKDPPFDSEFFYATHLLGQAEREGARVYNRPAALREHPEKLAILEFPQFLSPTLVTRDAQQIRDFHAQHGDIILKPLDGMGGMGIFRVKADGLNLGGIIETLNRDGAQTVMVQKFIPAIEQGDKRVLLINGVPVPFCLARIPQGGEVRGIVRPQRDFVARFAQQFGERGAPRTRAEDGDVHGRESKVEGREPEGSATRRRNCGRLSRGNFICALYVPFRG